MSRISVLSAAAAEIGQCETPPNSNKTKYGEWYGMNGVAWCAIFVSWAFDKGGNPLGKVDTPKGFHYCPSGYNYWKANNQLTATPQGGDIVLYDWGKDGLPDHTSIFVKDNGDGKTFTAIEGNTSAANDSNGGTVMKRVRYYSLVLAFVSPMCYADGWKPLTATPSVIVLKKGSVGREVVNLQKALNSKGAQLTADGFFGAKTEIALMAFQTANQLVADGIAGENTYAALGI